MLTSKASDKSDPFQQFLMDVDQQNTHMKEESPSEGNEQLIAIFQVVSSVCNLLLQFEISVLSSSNES